jgi:hypothetical protein
MKTWAVPLAAAALIASSVAALAARPDVLNRRVFRLPVSPPLDVALPRPADEAPSVPPPPDPALSDPRSFVSDPPPAEATPIPKPDEWKDAPSVQLTRDVAACHAYRVREWVKIHCAGFPAAGVSQLAGTRTGVALWVDTQKDPSETMKTLRSAEAIFPLRRGDGRLIQVAQFGEGYDGPIAWNLAYTISEQWVEGDRAPLVIVR